MHKHREKCSAHPSDSLVSFTVTPEAVTMATETCPKVTGRSMNPETRHRLCNTKSGRLIVWQIGPSGKKLILVHTELTQTQHIYKHRSMQACETCGTPRAGIYSLQSRTLTCNTCTRHQQWVHNDKLEIKVLATDNMLPVWHVVVFLNYGQLAEFCCLTHIIYSH